MIRTCADWGIAAGRHPEHRGAWIGSRKVGAVGVHLSRWISTHGLAFNADADLAHFGAIVPCGIGDPSLGVTTLAAELRRSGRAAPPLDEVEERLAVHLCELLGREREDGDFDLQTISVTATRADGKVLLLRRSEERGGFWQQVTGRIEPGESAASRGPPRAPRGDRRRRAGPAARLRARLRPRAGPGRPGSAAGCAPAGRPPSPRVLPEGFEPRLSDEHREWGWFTRGRGALPAPLGRAAPVGSPRRGGGPAARGACPRPRLRDSFSGSSSDRKDEDDHRREDRRHVDVEVRRRAREHHAARPEAGVRAGLHRLRLRRRDQRAPREQEDRRPGDLRQVRLRRRLPRRARGASRQAQADQCRVRLPRARREGGRRLPRSAHAGAARLPGLDAPRAGERVPAAGQRAARRPRDAGRHRRGPQRVQQRGHPEGARG